MKVIMRVNISGTRDGAEWPPIGSPIELPDAEAVALLNAGMAESATAEVETATAEVETATAEVETAAMPAPTRTRRK